MKTIVIPDVHQRTQAVRHILNHETDYDEVVFLGDWFDSFYEPPKVTGFEETCEYLRHLVLDHPNKDKFVFLIGNHDLSYIHENKDYSVHRISKTVKYYCSGFTASKAKKFRHQFFDRGLKDEFFTENFKMVHRTQGFTLSHAGLSDKHIPYGLTPDDVIDKIIPVVWKNFRDFTRPHNYLISGAGYCRGGDCNVGGVLWLDWNNEFQASEAIGKQIVGHTTTREPDCLAMGKPYESWNIDTEKDYGIIIDGRMTTKPIPEENPKKYKLSSRVTNLTNYEGTLRHDS
jgi:hypothetical protein